MILKEPCYHISQIVQNMKSPKVHKYALETWYEFMFPYIPYRTGALSETIDIQDDGIHFKMEYAEKVYFGDGWNFRKTVHPLAQAHWGRAALDNHGKQIKTIITAYALKE